MDSFRSGGGTHKFENEYDRSLERTAWDMRITSTRTLEHYLQEAPTHHIWHKLTPRQREQLMTLSQAVPAVVTQATFFLQMKVAPAMWPRLFAAMR